MYFGGFVFFVLPFGFDTLLLLIHETSGVYGKSTVPFLSGLTKKLVDVCGDPRERQWLHQRLSLAVARGNAASILTCVQV